MVTEKFFILRERKKENDLLLKQEKVPKTDSEIIQIVQRKCQMCDHTTSLVCDLFQSFKFSLV